MASRKRSISNDADVSVYKEWDETSCAICMDHPHNAVLLICSSHSKGCRSYICDTSYRHSNCLDRFKKLKEENPDNLPAPNLALGTNPGSIDTSATNLDSTTPVDITGGSNTHDAYSGFEETNMEKSEMSDLRCPLCRGSVLGWKVVEDARKYLNMKSRSCSHESCLFCGNYSDLRSHARRVHPTVRPADVDPSRQRAWRRLEDQREYNDIVSALRSAMPGAVVFGDYVMENGDRLSGESENRGEGERERGRLLSTLFLFQMIGSIDRGPERRGGRPRVWPRHRRATGNTFRRRYLWGENLLGLQDDAVEEEEEVGEMDLNVPSDLGDGVASNPRRRRRLTRARSDEDQL